MIAQERKIISYSSEIKKLTRGNFLSRKLSKNFTISNFSIKINFFTATKFLLVWGWKPQTLGSASEHAANSTPTCL
jgi:hypothetical protein